MVKAVRFQSRLQPSFFNCWRMMPPYFSFHSQAYSRNCSLVREDLLMPFSRSMATTLASVAIDAWSVPGTQHALKTTHACFADENIPDGIVQAMPMCSTPVTFGGGSRSYKVYVYRACCRNIPCSSNAGTTSHLLLKAQNFAQFHEIQCCF